MNVAFLNIWYTSLRIAIYLHVTTIVTNVACRQFLFFIVLWMMFINLYMSITSVFIFVSMKIHVPFISCHFTEAKPGPCLTTATWRCRNNFSQWECSFLWKLHCHWLKGLWQHQVTVVLRQGPVSGLNKMADIWHTTFSNAYSWKKMFALWFS